MDLSRLLIWANIVPRVCLSAKIENIHLVGPSLNLCEKTYNIYTLNGTIFAEKYNLFGTVRKIKNLLAS